MVGNRFCFFFLQHKFQEETNKTNHLKKIIYFFVKVTREIFFVKFWTFVIFSRMPKDSKLKRKMPQIKSKEASCNTFCNSANISAKKLLFLYNYMFSVIFVFFGFTMPKNETNIGSVRNGAQRKCYTRYSLDGDT